MLISQGFCKQFQRRNNKGTMMHKSGIAFASNLRDVSDKDQAMNDPLRQ